jgi:hypothetical protein
MRLFEIFGDFDSWFTGSAMQDRGEPIMFYHGTNHSGFDKFDPNMVGGIGFHFTTDMNATKQFGKNVIRAYLNIKNPAGLDEWKNALDKARGGNPRRMAIDILKKSGYDGVSTEYETIAFEPEQIWVVK